jgi:hypothetical protein
VVRSLADEGFPNWFVGRSLLQHRLHRHYFVIGEDFTVRLLGGGSLHASYQAPNDTFADGLDFARSIVETVAVGG